MANVTRESSSDDGIWIDEYTVELDGDEIKLDEQFDEGLDGVIVVKALEGELFTDIEAPEPALREDSNGGRLVSFSAENGVSVSVSLASRGYAKVKVFIGKIRSGIKRAARTIPCSLCKKSVALLMFGFLVAAGVPPTPALGFDLTTVKTALAPFFKDVATGVLGSALQSLVSYFSPNWSQTIEVILRGLQWIFDPAGPLYESACKAFNLCP